MRRVLTQDRDLGLAIRKPPTLHTEKENTLIPMNSTNAILDALAAQQQQGETSLIVTIKPDLIQDATNALRDYRKLLFHSSPVSRIRRRSTQLTNRCGSM